MMYYLEYRGSLLMCLSLVKSEVSYASRLKKYIWTLDLRACDQKPERFYVHNCLEETGWQACGDGLTASM